MFDKLLVNLLYIQVGVLFYFLGFFYSFKFIKITYEQVLPKTTAQQSIFFSSASVLNTP